jgi:hypothetical protein
MLARAGATRIEESAGTLRQLRHRRIALARATAQLNHAARRRNRVRHTPPDGERGRREGAGQRVYTRGTHVGAEDNEVG